MSYAWQSTERQLDRDLQVLLADKQVGLGREQLDSQESTAWGRLAARVLEDPLSDFVEDLWPF